MLRKQIDELFQQEMDRRDFLKYGMIAAVTLIGIPSIVRALTEANTGSHRTLTNSRHSYSFGEYGGKQMHKVMKK